MSKLCASCLAKTFHLILEFMFSKVPHYHPSELLLMSEPKVETLAASIFSCFDILSTLLRFSLVSRYLQYQRFTIYLPHASVPATCAPFSY